MIRCILIDDEIDAIRNLEDLLGHYPFIHIIERITDPRNAVDFIYRQNPDLLFVDVQMPYKNGFEILDDLDKLAIRPVVVFVTAFDHFAIEAIRHAAVDYLIKPVKEEELRSAVSRVEKKQYDSISTDQIRRLIAHSEAADKIKINSSGGFIMLNPEDIMYIKADWNYSEIVLGDDKKEMVTVNLGTLEKQLDIQTFFRLNRSLIINLKYIKKVNRIKRIITLVKEGTEFQLTVPLFAIRRLEKAIESNRTN